VAGRDVLKLGELSEDRRSLVSGGVKNLRVGRKSLLWTSNDVQWNRHEYFKHLLCTASTNGKIVVWNLDKPGCLKQERVLDDHTRTVNRVGWHLTDPHLVLSGSQDGTIKLWDIRQKEGCVKTILPGTGPVRDVQWSPLSPWSFAAGFDSGHLQIWDARSVSEPQSQLLGHPGHPVLTIDWHPEKRELLASGSRDKAIKVWDVEDSKTAVCEIQTIASVARVGWRPSHPNDIASSSTIFDNRILVWDLNDPFIPIAAMHGHTDVSTGFVWGTEDGSTVISCSKDSTVRLFLFEEAFFPKQKLRTGCLSWSPVNNLSVISDTVFRDLVESSISKAPQISLFGQTASSSKTPSGSKAPGFLRIYSDRFLSLGIFRLATRYELPNPKDSSRRSIQHYCHKNAEVASQEGFVEVNQIWEAVAALFPDRSDQRLDRSSYPSSDRPEETEGSTTSKAFDNFGIYFKSKQTPVVPPKAESDRIASDNAGFPSLDDISPEFRLDVVLDNNFDLIRNRIIEDLLLSCIDNGDVQTPVSLLIILKEVFCFDNDVSRKWFFSYSDILRRMDLKVQATEILHHSPDPAVRSLNQVRLSAWWILIHLGIYRHIFKLFKM
jgi:WD40 repeat protein